MMNRYPKHRIGIYPGTFDPVHSGHIAFAQETMRICELDEVVFLPEQKPRGKHGVTSLSHRLAILKRATATISNLRAIQLDSGQFTVQQTLPELHQLFEDSSLTLLIGSDIIYTLPLWENLETLLKSVSLAIGIRANDDPSRIVAVLEQLTQTYGIPLDYNIVKTTQAAVTSSQIRSGTITTIPMHPDVVNYIQEHSLYI